jgi:2-haloacid dehalogenase
VTRSYRAILFDVYGTLLDVHGVAIAAEAFFRGSGPALSQAWRRKQLEYTWLRTLAGRHADFWQVTGDALDYASEELNLALLPHVRTELMQRYLRLPAFAEAASVLSALGQADRRLAALSNGSPSMLNTALTGAGLAPLLDAVISIEPAGAFKVAPQAYQLAIERFGGSPHDFLLISSNGWDVAGATYFGFDSFWVNRTNQPQERLGIEPTAIGQSLGDLVSWLAR